MRSTRSMLAAAMMGALGLGANVVAPTDNRAVIPTERQDIRKQQRQLDRPRRRMRDPKRAGALESARRRRQIAAGQLRAENGLIGRA